MATRRILRGEVYPLILEYLTEGRWRPGERLGIESLARELKVSATPVREALASLEQSGLIEYRANSGYVAAPILPPDRIGELVDARLIVEHAALSRAFQRWDDFVVDLRTSHATHERSAREMRETPSAEYERVLHYFTADAEFHGAFFRHAGNSYLSEMRKSLNWDAQRMRQTWTHTAELVDAEEAIVEHAAILAQVEVRNHDGALAALRDHLHSVRARSTALQQTTT